MTARAGAAARAPVPWAWALLPPAFALATFELGWPAVPAAAAVVAGTAAVFGPRLAPSWVALSAACAWCALLAFQLTGAQAGDVARTLGGLSGLGRVAATGVAAALTLALAVALAWPAAVLGALAGEQLRRRWGRGTPRADAVPGAVTLDPPGLPAAPSGAPLGPSAAAPP